MKDIPERKIEALESLTEGQAKAEKGADRRQEKLTSSLASPKDQNGNDDRDHDLFEDEDGDRKKKRKGRLGRTAKKGRKLFRTLGKVAKGGGKLLGRLAAPLAVLSALPALVRAFKSGDREQVGRAGGSLVGGAGGAAIGTAILPGIGTAIGGVVGAFAGDFVGGAAGEALGGMTRHDELEQGDRERIEDAEDVGSLGHGQGENRPAQADGPARPQEKPETVIPGRLKERPTANRGKAEKPVVFPSLRQTTKPRTPPATDAEQVTGQDQPKHRPPETLTHDTLKAKRTKDIEPAKKPLSTPSRPQQKAEQEQTGAAIPATVTRKERKGSLLPGQEAASRPKNRDRGGRVASLVLPDLRQTPTAQMARKRPPEPQELTSPPAIPAWMEQGIAKGEQARKEQDRRERILRTMMDTMEQSFRFRKSLVEGLRQEEAEEQHGQQRKTFPQRWKDHDEPTLTLMHYDRL